MQQPRYSHAPRTAPYRRTVARGVREHHSRTCTRSHGKARCSCRPTYVAAIRRGDETFEQTFATRAEAVTWVEAIRDRIRRGEPDPTPVAPAPPLSDVAASFLHRAAAGQALTQARKRYAAGTLQSYDIALRRRVLPHIDARTGHPIGQLPVDRIDARCAQALVDAIAAREGFARARAAAAALGAVLRHGYLQGIIAEPPPRLVLPPPPPRRTVTLTPAEAKRLLAAARADDRALGRSLMEPLISLLLGSGARISEALGLCWGPAGLDLAASPPTMHVARSTTKTDAGARDVLLDGDTATALRRHRLARGRPADGAPVFPGRGGEPLGRDGSVRKGFRRVARAAGLPGVTPHVLRHTHATWLAAAGVPASAAAARLGHADGGAEFLRVYAHPGVNEARAALDSLERFCSTAGSG